MEPIKSITIQTPEGIRYLTLMKFEDSKSYEIQWSTNDVILETEGDYSRKSDAIKVFNAIAREKKKKQPTLPKHAIMLPYKAKFAKGWVDVGHVKRQRKMKKGKQPSWG